MKIKFKNNPEQVELIRAMGSKNKIIATEAQETFAALAGPIVSEVLKMGGFCSMLYTDSPYDENDSPSIPLDLWYNEDAGFINVWSQTIAGGLPSNYVHGMEELKVSTFRLDSAVSMHKKYARQARLDVVSKALTRLAQEVLVKVERNGWAVILQALGQASTLGNAHTVAATAANVLQLNDISRLLTRAKRINASFNNGTPDPAQSKGITDLFVSPEIMQEVRSWIYMPANPTVANSSEPDVSAIALPDAVREEIYRNAGAGSIWGIVFHELLELGISQKYNTLFGEFATGNIDPGGSTFATGDEEVLVGVDLSREALISPIETSPDYSGSFQIVPDDQFVSRQEKLGWYGNQVRGFACVDSRVLTGLIV